jgi:hypothetical protein
MHVSYQIALKFLEGKNNYFFRFFEKIYKFVNFPLFIYKFVNFPQKTRQPPLKYKIL